LTGSVRHAFIKLTSAMRYKVKESLKVKYKGTVHSLRFTYRVKVFAKKKNNTNKQNMWKNCFQP